MDEKTAKVYEESATLFSADWLEQPTPNDMYALLKKYLVPGGITLDVGCGSGRDTAWLKANGFKAAGCDASAALVKIASQIYPNVGFLKSVLPDLVEVDTKCDNIVCETVIMHLSKDQITASLKTMKNLLKPNGRMYLSWRVTSGADTRSKDGRLYSAFEPSFIVDQFDPKSVLHFEDKISESSGKRICRLIVQAQ